MMVCRLRFGLSSLVVIVLLASCNSSFAGHNFKTSNEIPTQKIIRIVHQYSSENKNENVKQNYVQPMQQFQEQRIPITSYLPPQASYETNQLTAGAFMGQAYLPPPKTTTVLKNMENYEEKPQPTYKDYYAKEQKLNDFNNVPLQMTIQVPTYLPPGYDAAKPNEGNQIAEAPSSELPDGYDFVKPPDAEEAIAELHTLPADEPQRIPEPKAPQQRFTAPISKIRTVQILSSGGIKTWKVLETDNFGVKTIKILGPSQEKPTGPHRVINVEAPGLYSQTLKVFNDFQDPHSSSFIENNYNNLPSQTYLPYSQEYSENHKRSLRVSTESFHSSLRPPYHTNFSS